MIRFKDPEVLRVLVDHGVGMITEEDCAKVTSIEDWFVNNKSIKTFNEFKYFGLTSIGGNSAQGFQGSSIEEITLPSPFIMVSSGGQNGMFSGCTKLKKLDFGGCTRIHRFHHLQGCSSLETVVFHVPITVDDQGVKDRIPSTIKYIFIDSIATYLKNSYASANYCFSKSGNASLYLIGSEEPLTSLTIPSTLTAINAYALYNLKTITSISYEGTIEQWLALPKGTDWHTNVPVEYIQCTDGKAGLDDTEQTGNTYES